MRQKILSLVRHAVLSLAKEREKDSQTLPEITVERPRREEHGDFAFNVAAFARALAPQGEKPNPRKLAEDLRTKIGDAEGFLEAPPEIAGAYLNFRISRDQWLAVLGRILDEGEKYGRSSPKASPRLNLEFVSANPTGPMHVGHGRGAAYGDALGRILRAAGYDVTREFYINDRGNQARLFGISVHIRYKELLGEPVTPPPDAPGKPQWYKDEYVIEIAKKLREVHGEKFAGRAWEEEIPEIRAFALAEVKAMQAAGRELPRGFKPWERSNQAQALGKSVHIRYKELLGEPVTPPPDLPGKPQWYVGDYIIEIAKKFRETYGDKFAGRAWEEEIPEFREFGIAAMMARIKEDLAAFGVSFDVYTSERAIFERGLVQKVLDDFKDRGLVEEKEGALWFRTRGEEEDRVLRKKDGDLTYFATDIAYHKDKLDRGFTHLIDVWGADHHGYIPRMKDAVSALGASPDSLEVLLVQFVTLASGRMGKRSGNFVTLRELVDEVGKDAARFFFLMRSADSQLEFDLDLARKEGLDNPVYHAQYGHARCCSLLERARSVFGREVPAFSLELARGLVHAEELSLVRRLESFPELVESAAEVREPHRIISFITDLSQAFQRYYTWVGKTQKEPVLPQKSHREEEGWEAKWDWKKTDARLLLVEAVRQVLSNALYLAGVSAPTRMAKVSEEEGD